MDGRGYSIFLIECYELLHSRLRNDLHCVEWDVKLYYTIPFTVYFISWCVMPGTKCAKVKKKTEWYLV